MNKKYVFYGALIAVMMIGYQIFLIQRDQRMYDAYYCQTVGCANER